MKKIILLFTTSLFFVSVFSQSQSLSQQEKDGILFMREEEKLARDVYDSLFIKWEARAFGNIRKSEQRHTDRMKDLITTFTLQDPVENKEAERGYFKTAHFKKLYTELTSKGSLSLIDAFTVGALIEEIDIKDLEERIQQTTNTSIITTYQQLKAASGNHLRAFVRNLKMNDVTYKPTVLSKEQFEKIMSQ